MNGVLERHWTVAEAAQLLGVSECHTWRILAAYRTEGAAALAHGNRLRLPLNATPKVIRTKIIELARERYSGFNHTHFTELLEEREGIVVSRSTVRRLLTFAGLASPRHRRPPCHRYRRARMPQEGMLVQVDGSHHRWLGEQGPLVHPASGRRRCHWNSTLCTISEAGRHRRLFPVNERHHTATGNSTSTVQRSLFCLLLFETGE
jgi:transposase